MSSNEELNDQTTDSEISTEEMEQIRASAKTTLYVSIAMTLVWLFGYNMVVHEMGPVLAFFKVLDGINELVI